MKAGKADDTFSSKDNSVTTLSYTFSILGLQTLQIVDTAARIRVATAIVNVLAKK